MATVKQYVDLEGLSKFKELLVAGYANGDFSVLNATNATNAEIATNYKTADGSASIKDALASKVDSSTLTTEVNKLVPKTATIAGVDLSDNITASELITALDNESKIVNVIETVKVKNNGDADFSALQVTDKAVQIDLSKYAKVSDITAVLKFKGVKQTFPELPTPTKDMVGHVWIVTEGAEYAEYVCVDTNGDYKWEKLGVGVDLSNYYTIDETNSAISTAVSNAKTQIETDYKAADTDLQNTLQGKIDALYKVDGDGKDTGVIAGRLDAVETKATNNASAIATLKGGEAVEGSVAKAIKDKIDALDSTSSMASDTDVKGGYVYSVSQTDGVVAVKTASFSGSVASGDANAVTGGAVATYVTGEIANLDVEDVGSDGSFISVVGETDGKVHATTTDFVATVKAETTDADIVASNEHAVRTAIDSAYEMITSIPLTGDSGSIASIFANLVSKTRGLISRTIEVAESDSVTSIGEGAFQDCSSLTSISFPVATSIGSDAFNECSSLTSVSVPKATSIGNSAFYRCSALTNIDSPLVTSLETSAFNGCSKLVSVEFPLATSVGNVAFYNCSALTNISFPVATSAGYQTFAYCSKLINVSIPKATIIDYQAFAVCKSLTSIDFPLATSIGKQAFADCSSLTSVSFPVVTSIGQYAFESCSSLTEVSFPKATSIEGYAFYNCSNLTTIYVGTESGTVCTLSSTTAFNNCNNLTNIYVPESLVDSYKSATNWSSFASKIKVDIQPVKCIALSITADDVAIGNETSTTVHYMAECTYTKEGVLQEGTMVFTGEATSDSFEQNTSMTDTIQRTVSFTFLGQTATTTITQGVWVNQSISVTTSGISDYGWVTADNTYNVDGYDVYMSNNKGVDSSNAVMKLECVGYTKLTIYIRSYAEGSYDYTIASNANASTYPTAYNDSTAKAHTSGIQKPGTALKDYTAVEYTGLSGNDIIYIVFRKDSGDAKGDDRGYVLIPKQA